MNSECQVKTYVYVYLIKHYEEMGTNAFYENAECLYIDVSDDKDLKDICFESCELNTFVAKVYLKLRDLLFTDTIPSIDTLVARSQLVKAHDALCAQRMVPHICRLKHSSDNTVLSLVINGIAPSILSSICKEFTTTTFTELKSQLNK